MSIFHNTALQVATGFAMVQAMPTNTGRPVASQLAPHSLSLTESLKQETVELFSCDLCSFASICRDSFKNYVCIHNGKEGLFCLETTNVKVEGNAENPSYFSKECLNSITATYNNSRPEQKEAAGASEINKGILLIANSDDIALQAATGLAEVLVAKAAPTKIGRPLERRLAPRPPGMTVSEKQKTEQVYTCKLCSFSSIYANSLMDHVRTHSGKKGLLCLVCQRTFPDTYRLKRHILSHTGEKKYKCNLCPYATVSSTFLERHVRTHTGEKNFACGVCDYVCARMDTLKRHVNKVHSGNKPMKRIII
nr:zinc finger protein 64-like [Rhipicephalus microplus]